MATLTCLKHPWLIWSCKDMTVSGGRYNHTRSLFFMGYHMKEPYSDGSGWKGDLLYRLADGNAIPVTECSCSVRYLIQISDETGEIDEQWLYGPCPIDQCLSPKGAQAQFVCRQCEKPYCQYCEREVDGKHVCRECFLKARDNR